jgi:hypothetical protein
MNQGAGPEGLLAPDTRRDRIRPAESLFRCRLTASPHPPDPSVQAARTVCALISTLSFRPRAPKIATTCPCSDCPGLTNAGDNIRRKLYLREAVIFPVVADPLPLDYIRPEHTQHPVAQADPGRIGVLSSLQLLEAEAWMVGVGAEKPIRVPCVFLNILW